MTTVPGTLNFPDSTLILSLFPGASERRVNPRSCVNRLAKSGSLVWQEGKQAPGKSISRLRSTEEGKKTKKKKPGGD